MKWTTKVLVRSEEILWQVIDDEVVLIDGDEAELIRLNEIGREIWQALDGRRTIGEVVEDIGGRFDVGRRRAEKDVVAFVKQLLRREIVTPVAPRTKV